MTHPDEGRFWTREQEADWPYQFFSPDEIRSKDGPLFTTDRAMWMLVQLRHLWGGPLVVLSGYRTPEHNAAVGGAPNSYHMAGRAFDLQCSGPYQASLAACAVFVGFRGIGTYKTFLHFDNRPDLTFWQG